MRRHRLALIIVMVFVISLVGLQSTIGSTTPSCSKESKCVSSAIHATPLKKTPEARTRSGERVTNKAFLPSTTLSTSLSAFSWPNVLSAGASSPVGTSATGVYSVSPSDERVIEQTQHARLAAFALAVYSNAVDQERAAQAAATAAANARAAAAQQANAGRCSCQRHQSGKRPYAPYQRRANGMPAPLGPTFLDGMVRSAQRQGRWLVDSTSHLTP